VVQITTDTGAATLTNAGTIEAPSASGVAISETGGNITIDNSGTIIGEVTLANTTFNNESGGVWDVSGVNTFGSGSNTIDNAGTFETSGTTTIGVAFDNSGTIEVQSGTLLFDAAVSNSGAGQALIVGGILDFAATSNVGEITFNNGTGGTTYGELILGAPSGYTATINGFAGTAPSLSDSDGIELAGTWTVASETASGGNLVLVLQEAGSENVTLTFDDFSGTLNIATPGGNTLITDPPKTSPSGNSSLTAETAPTPVELALGRDQFNFGSGWTAGQSDGVSAAEGQRDGVSAAEGQRDSSENQSASVSLGGPGNDNFLFHPALGADTGHFDSPAAATEFGQFASAREQHWLSLIKDDAIEFAHHSDGIRPPDSDVSHWHLALQHAFHLH